jgi:ankyrin repeat protein
MASAGDLAAVERLLAGGAEVDGAEVDERGRNAETPLIAATLAGRRDVAEVLLARGADVQLRPDRLASSGSARAPQPCSHARGW